jgi:Na+/H+ antiporter NhaA
MAASPPTELSGQTESWGAQSPLRAFLRTEIGSSALLLAAALAAVVWANADLSGYELFWHNRLSFQFGTHRLSLPLREWVNSGLMTLFFFVLGMEARREFDMGELRDRKRLALPLAAGLSGMVVPICVYLAFNAGQASAHGWGTAMSTDTAFALGTLAVLGRRMPQGLRVFILTIAVVDDFLALGVIAVFYSSGIAWTPLFVALAIFGTAVAARLLNVRRGFVYVLLAAAAWIALLRSGVDPVVIGLAMGLLPYAAPASRSSLEHASGLFRLFREQPTPEMARSVRAGLAFALAPNERLQRLYHPWTSYAIVPLFALANAGISIDASLLSQASASSVALGIFFGLLIGKPVGILGASAMATWLSRGRVQPPAGWGAVTVGGALSSAGFTVSLLIAARAFHGPELEEAKAGVLAALVGSFVVSWTVTGVIALLPHPVHLRALVGKAEAIVDLAVPVDPDRDHIRGPGSAPVTVVEYGDYECLYCGRAEPVIRDLLGSFTDVRYVWRHLPLKDVHVHAQLAAEAAEAAASQGVFWQMHDMLMTHQGSLQLPDLRQYAARIGMDIERFEQDLQERVGATHVAEDVESADLSGVAGTPTFFINGLRHHGAYDIDSLSAAVRAARQRMQVAKWRGGTSSGQRPGSPW